MHFDSKLFILSTSSVLPLASAIFSVFFEPCQLFGHFDEPFLCDFGLCIAALLT